MTEYIAITYVKDSAGQMISPGEIFDAAYTDEQEAWLAGCGAIRRADECTQVNAEPAQDAVEDEEADESEAETIPETESEAADETMTIDVMEGIVKKPRTRRTKA